MGSPETIKNELRIAALFHYHLHRCSICGDEYKNDDYVWEEEAKEIYSRIRNKFPKGVVKVRAHSQCWADKRENPH